MKIFQIGFNKCGTTSFYEIFQSVVYPKLNCVHWDHGFLAYSMYKNFLSNKKMLEGKYENYDFFSDMEACFLEDEKEKFIYIYMNFFKRLDKEYPESKFILNIRSKENWITSRLNHYCPFSCIENNKVLKTPYKNYYYKQQMNFYSSSLENLKTIWSDQYDSHISSVKKYFKNRPEDLLIFDIEKDNLQKIKNFFPQFIFSHNEFPHCYKTNIEN